MASCKLEEDSEKCSSRGVADRALLPLPGRCAGMVIRWSVELLAPAFKA